jgi:hypothetical protein
MSRASIGWDIIVLQVFALVAIIYQFFKTSIAEFVPIFIEVIKTHLIYNNAYYQFRWLGVLCKKYVCKNNEKGE